MTTQTLAAKRAISPSTPSISPSCTTAELNSHAVSGTSSGTPSETSSGTPSSHDADSDAEYTYHPEPLDDEGYPIRSQPRSFSLPATFPAFPVGYGTGVGSKTYLVRLDNIPLGITWKNIKFFLGQVTNAKNILHVQVLADIPGYPAESALITVRSVIAAQQILCLNGYIWDYQPLVAYFYNPFFPLPPMLGVPQPLPPHLSHGFDLPVDKHRVFVGNIPYRAKWDNLRGILQERGHTSVTRVEFPFTEDGFSKGFAVVSFASEDEAETAMNDLEGQEFLGRPLMCHIDKFPSKFRDGMENVDVYDGLDA